MVSITNVYLTHAKKSQVETESTVDIKTLVYTEKIHFGFWNPKNKLN